MKKVFVHYIIVATLATSAAFAQEPGKITMSRQSHGEVRFLMEGTGKATVDWGDGTTEECSLEETEEVIVYTCSHITGNDTTWIGAKKGGDRSRFYIGDSLRTITITGENITLLECRNNKITSIDISKNAALTELDCSRNQLTSLDVSKNAALTVLDCSGNQLTSLDVSKNAKMKSLKCYTNQLPSLEVSKNAALTELDCSGNPLTSLDVSKNDALTVFHCSNNELTSLDVSKNTTLSELVCPNNQLTSLDVSRNTALTELNCWNNWLTSLDVSKNTALAKLSLSWNQLDAAALNALFETLHSDHLTVKWIRINHNPGEKDCDRSIAINKGWGGLPLK